MTWEDPTEASAFFLWTQWLHPSIQEVHFPLLSKQRWYYGRAILATKCTPTPPGPCSSFKLNDLVQSKGWTQFVCVSQIDLLKLYPEVIVCVQGLRRKENGEDRVPRSSLGQRKELRLSTFSALCHMRPQERSQAQRQILPYTSFLGVHLQNQDIEFSV